MPNPGYIYVLINYAMPDLVKVGFTERSPATRLEELSSATGVPTPFVLVYDVLVPDAEKAEQMLHNAFAARGYRVSENREFFNAPIHEVVKLLIQLRESMESSSLGQNVNDQFPQNLGSQQWDPMLREAIETITRTGQASTSMLQRKLRIGYTRAARLMDELEDLGLVGPPAKDTQSRDILMSEQEIEHLLQTL